LVVEILHFDWWDILLRAIYCINLYAISKPQAEQQAHAVQLAA